MEISLFFMVVVNTNWFIDVPMFFQCTRVKIRAAIHDVFPLSQ
jgi:hypothetical protein